MIKVDEASWDETYAGHFVIDVEGWLISIYNDCNELDYCEECMSVDVDAELTQVLTKDCPTSKSKQIQQRKWFARNRLGQ